MIVLWGVFTLCQALLYTLHALTHEMSQQFWERSANDCYYTFLIIMPIIICIPTSVSVSYFLTVLGYSLVIWCLSDLPKNLE